MRWRHGMAALLGGCVLAGASAARAAPPATRPAAAIPDSFVDPETHLTVVHLSRVPADWAGVIYFTYPSFTQDSRLTLWDVQFGKGKWRHLYSFDFTAGSIAPLVTDRLTQDQVVAAKTGHLYYLADNAAWVTNLAGGTPRKIADVPAKWVPGAGFSVNADETLLLGASTDVDGPPADPDAPAESMGQTFAKHQPNVLFTIDIHTGAVKVIHRINTWLGHVQFSPTDPALLMFCHEGPAEQVERIWTLRLGEAEPKLMHKRPEPREIVTHEFWAPDGKSIWFQQAYRAQRGKSFLTGLDLATGKQTQLTVPEGGRGIHYTWAPDGTYLVSDGSGPKSDQPGPNKFLSALVPEGDHVRVVKLCSLQRNDYSIEPNPHVSPDNRWVTFTATLFGTPQAYAVEVPPGQVMGSR